MLKGKSWAMLAAVAAVAFGSTANAEGPSSADQLTLSQPVMAQTEPTLTPLMAGLDAVGLAKPLQDARINIGGYISGSTTFYADRAATKFQPGRSFDSEDQDLTLNQVGVFVERTVEVTSDKFDIGARVEWIYGGDARFIHSTGTFDHYGPGNGPEQQFDPVQSYVDIAVPVGNGLRIRTGKFITPAGVEVINPTNNALYSRGLLFNYLLPFTHTGVVANYVLNESWTFELGVVRGWDDSLEDKNNNGVTILSTIGYTFADKKSSLAVVILSGPEFADDNSSTRSLLDVVFTHKYSDELTFKVQADGLWETDKDGQAGLSNDYAIAAGLGGWASYKFSDYVTVNGRLEYLYDGQGIRFSPGTGNNVYSATLGLTVTPLPTNSIGSNLKIRPEMRYDYAAEDAFGGNNHQLSASIEAYFTF